MRSSRLWKSWLVVVFVSHIIIGCDSNQAPELPAIEQKDSGATSEAQDKKVSVQKIPETDSIPILVATQEKEASPQKPSQAASDALDKSFDELQQSAKELQKAEQKVGENEARLIELKRERERALEKARKLEQKNREFTLWMIGHPEEAAKIGQAIERTESGRATSDDYWLLAKYALTPEKKKEFEDKASNLSPQSTPDNSQIPGRLSGLVHRMEDTKKEADLLIRNRFNQAKKELEDLKKDLEDVKRGAISRKLKNAEHKITNAHGNVKYKFISKEAKEFAIEARKREIERREKTLKDYAKVIGGNLTAKSLYQNALRGWNHGHLKNPFGGVDPELRKAADKMKIDTMQPMINGEPGQLPRAKVAEVWGDGEIVVTLTKVREGADRILLKGADTKMVADGFGFFSKRIWMVTGKQTYRTAIGLERSILVAEPVDLSPYLNVTQFGVKQTDSCCLTDNPTARCHRTYSRIVQIIGKDEMLVTMRVATSPKHSTAIVLLRGVDTTALTEDSMPPSGKYAITGTYRYENATGGSSTVFVATK